MRNRRGLTHAASRAWRRAPAAAAASSGLAVLVASGRGVNHRQDGGRNVPEDTPASISAPGLRHLLARSRNRRASLHRLLTRDEPPPPRRGSIERPAMPLSSAAGARDHGWAQMAGIDRSPLPAFAARPPRTGVVSGRSPPARITRRVEHTSFSWRRTVSGISRTASVRQSAPVARLAGPRENPLHRRNGIVFKA